MILMKKFLNGPESLSALNLVLSYLIFLNLGGINIIRQFIDSCKEIENNDSVNDNLENYESPV